MSQWQDEIRDLVDPAIARSTSIDRVVIAPNLLDRAAELVDDLPIAGGVLAIADENTMRAAGSRVIGGLKSAGLDVEELVFPGSPRLKPTTDAAGKIVDALETSNRVPVAIGSGVINDLVKYAAKLTDRDYACFATAASMDGYTSAGAPLSDQGFKHTIQCAPPRTIVADLDVIAAAPSAMTGWGYADLAGKLPAGADWIVADALGIEPIDPAVWPMVQSRLKAWLSEPEAIAHGDAGATAGLFSGLLMSGLAMEVHGSSRPASGADHQIAHLWEMEGLSAAGQSVSHGTCVALGSLTILSLYELLLAQEPQSIDIADRIRQWPDFDVVAADVRATFTEPRIAERAIAETRQKYIERDVLGQRLEHFRTVWPDLRERLAAFLPRMTDLSSKLRLAGVETHPSEVGVSSAYHRRTVLAARYLRRRYTILDLLAETGWLDPAINALFSPPGPWAEPQIASKTA